MGPAEDLSNAESYNRTCCHTDAEDAVVLCGLELLIVDASQLTTPSAIYILQSTVL